MRLHEQQQQQQTVKDFGMHLHKFYKAVAIHFQVNSRISNSCPVNYVSKGPALLVAIKVIKVISDRPLT